jgi:tellurite resistance protein TerC
LRCIATPLLVALIVINFADLIFAVDSVPAIFLITTDTFIVYTANIMAILGLRALYFALAALVHRFHYLKYALAVVLVFIGMKGFYSYFFGKPDPLPFAGRSPWVSLPPASSIRCGRPVTERLGQPGTDAGVRHC